MDHYSRARREGLRLYNAALQAHTDPYLPVLEDRIPNLSQLTRLSLGVQSVPLDRVIGSVSKGRSFAFTHNFMPILDGGSEFAGKWDRLYESVEDQGVNQPITALEYMGYYYVIEGNKRVSVMKSMDAVEIEADVTRAYPEKSDDPAYIAYEEYCEFTKETGLYTLLFTRPGSYAKLISLPGVRAGKEWTQDEILSLKKVYRYFREGYLKLMKDKPAMKDGDAFLTWLIAFGYETVKDEDQAKTTERIRLMAREFEVHDGRVQLVMDPEIQKQTPAVPLLSSLFRPSKIKAAFFFTRPPEESAWNYWHNLGRLELEEKLKDKVETTAHIIPSRGDFSQEIGKLIKDGYTAIFATSPVMLNSCIQPALEHPDVRFLCCSLLSSYTNIRTYYIRFHEAKFLMGLAAGILSENGKIGYVGNYPIYGTASSINAFAIGARMVNPKARIYLNWSCAKYFDPDDPFHDPEIRMICGRDFTAPEDDRRDYGLYMREGAEILNIASLIPRWGPFYRAITETILKGTFNPGENRQSATNYWWGINSHILDVVFSNRLDPYAARMITHFRHELKDDTFTPFEGKILDQAGKLRCEADQRLTPAEILCMEYLTDNVVGEFPKMDQLLETAKPLVRLQGIQGEQKPELETFSWSRK